MATVYSNQFLIIPKCKNPTAVANGFYYFVGMRGFEPPISGPPDQHFNRTKLHPEIYFNLKKLPELIQKAFFLVAGARLELTTFGL